MSKLADQGRASAEAGILETGRGSGRASAISSSRMSASGMSPGEVSPGEVLPVEVPLAWAQEAKRLQRRYEEEVVGAFALCPWAARARRDGKVAMVVSGLSSIDAGQCVQEMHRADRTSRSADIVFLLFPWLNVGGRIFSTLFSEARNRYEDAYPRGKSPCLMAAFHPEAARDVDTPETLVSWLRRTPDACVQMLRREALDRVHRQASGSGARRGGTTLVDVNMLRTNASMGEETQVQLTLAERVARDNHARLVPAHLETLEAVVASIREDRTQSYAALLRAGG